MLMADFVSSRDVVAYFATKGLRPSLLPRRQEHLNNVSMYQPCYFYMMSRIIWAPYVARSKSIVESYLRRRMGQLGVLKDLLAQRSQQAFGINCIPTCVGNFFGRRAIVRDLDFTDWWDGRDDGWDVWMRMRLSLYCRSELWGEEASETTLT